MLSLMSSVINRLIFKLVDPVKLWILVNRKEEGLINYEN